MKTILVLALVITFKVIATGQESCSLSLGQSPTIRGIRLGMTLNQLYDLIPEARNDKKISEALDQFKGSPLPHKVALQFNSYGTPYGQMPMFRNINYIGVRLFNNQVTDISIQYDWPSWNNADEFINKLRETIVLPELKDWQGTETNRRLRCKDFYMNVGAPVNGGALIMITDLFSNQKIHELEKAIIEKARKDFKP